jgi:hypothetical protein
MWRSNWAAIHPLWCWRTPISTRRCRRSGLGRYNGDWIMQEFTTDHWVTARQSHRHYPF